MPRGKTVPPMAMRHSAPLLYEKELREHASFKKAMQWIMPPAPDADIRQILRIHLAKHGVPSELTESGVEINFPMTWPDYAVSRLAFMAFLDAVSPISLTIEMNGPWTCHVTFNTTGRRWPDSRDHPTRNQE